MNRDGIRVLYADDDPTARLLMQSALDMAGFDLRLAVDGEDAVRQFAAQRCDIVLLDVDMPGLNGYQVCAALREAAGQELPIVMVTGMDDLRSIEQAYDGGATDFIPKPINWGLIAHRVRYLYRGYQALQDLRAANARNAAILSALPDTLLRVNRGGLVLDVRQALEVGLHCDAPRPGRPLAETYPAAIAARLLDGIARTGEPGEVHAFEFQSDCASAGARHFEARLAAIDGAQVLCLMRDITERKEAERRFHRLAYYDTLTGLANRQSFLEQLSREIDRAQVQGTRLAVLFLDLDGFKTINDTLGHGSGDLLLQWAADRLRQSVRPGDLMARAEAAESEAALARLGGDEFTTLIPNLKQADDALLVAHRIRDLMRRPFNLSGRAVTVTASIGIALYPEDGLSASALLKHADTAMYHAKDLGRDNCQFYSESLTERAMRRLNLEANLRLALERGEFALVYQPQLDLKSGRIQTVEALIRWEHPEQGCILPDDFIPAAEENGLIGRIGDWVLRTACTDAVRWRAAGHRLRVAVNLSSMQFRDANLVHNITGILGETGLAPDCLELELTEGTLMEDSESTLSTLTALRGAGIHLALDDFGTGWSSLSYLKRLPLTSLKVDRSFVHGVPHDRESIAIIRTIVALAKNLGFSVTAEGIETADQMRVIRDLSCDTAQGFYFSRPIPIGELLVLLNQ